MQKDLDELVAAGMLCQRTEGDEWLEPGNEAIPEPPDGYMVSFVPFHERGVGALLHH